MSHISYFCVNVSRYSPCSLKVTTIYIAFVTFLCFVFLLCSCVPWPFKYQVALPYHDSWINFNSRLYVLMIIVEHLEKNIFNIFLMLIEYINISSVKFCLNGVTSLFYILIKVTDKGLTNIEPSVGL